ncbi:Pycsar system effector family protein [Lentzea tibetensis]|nr:Pycsar system effector family protein [Lentzea tibetensis]
MTPPGEHVMTRIDQAQTDVADQLRRADAKAASLLPLFGGFLAGVVALTTRSMPAVVEVLLWLSALPMTASVLLLLSAVRPRISKHGRFGFALFAEFADRPSDLLTALAEETSIVAQAVVVCRSSVIVQLKYGRVRRAVDLLICGLLVLVVALVVTAVA